MRIGLISDTHGSTIAVDMAVKLAGEVDMWLHAGDIIEDAIYLKESYEVPVVNVAGNNDYWSDYEAKEDEFVEVAGRTIMLTHGHIYGVRGSMNGYRKLAAVAKHRGASVVVFGHSHISFVQEVDGVLLINPGSTTYPRDGKGNSFMVMEIDFDKEPEIYHYHLPDRLRRR